MLQDQPHAQGCFMYSAYVVSLMCPCIKEDSCARLEKNAYLILPESEIGDQHFQSHEQCTDTISQNTLRQNRQAQNLLIYSDSNATNDKDVHSTASMILKFLGAVLSPKKAISLQSYNVLRKAFLSLIHACSETKKKN